MISVASGLLTTLHGRLTSRAAASKRAAIKLDDIRQAMLDCLGNVGRERFPQVERRVMFASDIQSLWYLRPELLMVVSSAIGEQAAQERVAQLSAMFDGLLPKSLNSRPGGRAK
jgi:hypothetical protein